MKMSDNPVAVAGDFSRFVELTRYAAANSSFWQQRLSGFLRKPEIDRLAEIESLTGDDLHRYGPPAATDMLTGPLEGGYLTRSGGSSGQEKFSFTTYEEVSAGSTLLGQMFRLIGLGPKDRVANLFMPGHMYAAFTSVSMALEHTGCLQLPIGANTDPEQIFTYLERFLPNVLLAVPSAIMQIATELEDRNSHVRLTVVGYAGEHLDETSRQALRRQFGEQLRIHSLGYAAVDTGIIAFQHPDDFAGNRHRVPGEAVLVEIVDQQGHPVACGEEGEIVVSNLLRRRMPVIRYKVGDRGVLRSDQDGRGMILDLLGRSGKDIMLCGYAVSLAQIKRAFTTLAGSHPFQLRIRAAGLKFILEFHYESETEISGLSPARLLEALGRENPLFSEMTEGGLLETVGIVHHKPGLLPRSHVTGKLIPVIDERAQTSSKND
jgi:phenylacetate-CoA ligase